MTEADENIQGATMVNYQENNDTLSAHSPDTDKEIPVDTKRLAEAVIQLNISRKNVFIYPPGHTQVTESIDQTCKTLCKIFEEQPEITIGVAKDSLLVGTDYLDQKNPVYKQLALALSQHDIAAVTLCQGLNSEELLRFLGVIMRAPEDVRTAGGIEKAILDSDTPHIRIQAMDFGKLHLTEQEEIFRPQDAEERARENDIWQDFVAHLISGTPLTVEQVKLLNDPLQIDPFQLAHLMNEHNLDPKDTINSYEKVISDHLQEVGMSKQPFKTQSSSFEKLNMFLQELRPELRRQFLSVALQHSSSQSRSVQTDAFLSNFADDLVVEMLDQANREGREISTGLIRFGQKMSDTKNWVPTELGDGTTKPSTREPPPVISREELKSLFDRESHEEYVESDYDEMLKHVSQAAEIRLPHDDEAFPLDEYCETLEESHLTSQIARMLLAFMDEDIDEESYKDFSGKLVATLDRLLERGEFLFLLKVFDTLTQHCANKPHPGVRDVAIRSLQEFSESGFVLNAVAAFETWANQRGREASDFLYALGPKVIPGLLDLYVNNEYKADENILLNLLRRFGQAAFSEAKKKLRDIRPHIVKKFLILIRRIANQEDVSCLRPLLKHEDQNIRTEVLEILLKLRDPWAVFHLQKALRSKNAYTSSQAIFLAGKYQVSDVAQELVSMIKGGVFLQSSYEQHERIIKALGQIGDPCAIPALERLAQTQRTLYPKSLLRMKRVLFESLDRYPHEHLTALLNIGKQSADHTIQEACRKLMARQ